MTVIGIVAAESIPVLVSNIGDAEILARLNKSYAVLSQATLMIHVNCSGSVLNCVDDPNAIDDHPATLTKVAELYTPFLSIAQNCGLNHGCFPDGVIYSQLDDSPYNEVHDIMNYYKFTLNDGSIIAVDWNGASNWPENAFHFMVDLNGRKGPNKFGRDTFRFCYNPANNQLEPAGLNAEVGTCDDTTGNGRGCTARVLKEGAINY